MVFIREGIKKDCISLIAMFKEFGEYLGKANVPEIDAQQLERDGFSDQDDKRLFRVIVAQLDEYDDQLIGYVLFYYKYSGWYGKCVWIEHLYIKSELRCLGVGAKLLSALANHALDNDCARVEWYCYSWQEDSIRFYKRNGAIDASIGLNKYAFDKNALESLADKQE